MNQNTKIIKIHDYNMTKQIEELSVLHGPIDTLKIASKGDMVLKVALRSIGRTADAKQVFDAWPPLKTASIKLCSLITHDYPHIGFPRAAIEHILGEAFTAFLDNNSHPEGYVAVERLLSYLTVLRNSADELQNISVYAKLRSDLRQWDWFSEPIGTWAKRIGARQIYFAENNLPVPTALIAGGRNKLSSVIMTTYDQGRVAAAYPSHVTSGAVV